MGIGFEQAHFFTMFFAVFAFLTPPVALVALIAAKLADAPYIQSAVEATKAAIGGFIIPFMFIYCPVLLLQPQDILGSVTGIIAAIMCLFVLEMGFVGYCFTDCTVKERVLAGFAGLALFISIVLKSHILFAVGFVICAGLMLLQRWKWKTNNLMGIKDLRELERV
jgi:TRAP-type uncharacterized transport system fused permease subunit